MEIDSKRWPAWCNGPNGETAIINSPDELPKDWHHPRLGKKAAASASASPEPVPAPISAPDSAEEVDAAGWAWSPDLHASSKSKTKDGLWRMKVGVTRPAPKLAPLDL